MQLPKRLPRCMPMMVAVAQAALIATVEIEEWAVNKALLIRNLIKITDLHLDGSL